MFRDTCERERSAALCVLHWTAAGRSGMATRTSFADWLAGFLGIAGIDFICGNDPKVNDDFKDHRANIISIRLLPRTEDMFFMSELQSDRWHRPIFPCSHASPGDRQVLTAMMSQYTKQNTSSSGVQKSNTASGKFIGPGLTRLI